MQDLIQQLASELDKDPRHVENVVRLLDEGNTIPFIARYRKELHGAMDDTALRNLEERLQYLRNLAERREAVKRSIEEQGKLTEELSAAIDAARTLAEVEDLYRPYKQKRRTRATIAREKGLAPLAELLFAQGPDCPDPTAEAARYVDAEKGVETVEDALSGASDIIAETISDDAALRKTLRTLLEREGKLCSQAAVEEDSVYRLYYDFSQALSRLQGHQILAVNRGEKEGFLKVRVELDRDRALPGRPAACDRPRQRRNGIYQVRGGGRIRPPDLPRPGAGGSLRPDGAGGRGGHRPVRPESEAPADAAPGEGQGHHGPGPGIPDGLQGGGGGRHGQSAGHRRGIPHLRRAAGERGYRRPGKADPKARRGAHRHRQWHSQPGDGADGGEADPAGE